MGILQEGLAHLYKSNRFPWSMTFVRTPVLDDLVKRWTSYCEDLDFACEEIMSRKDLVLNRDRNNLIGALGEAAMGQYIYDGLNNDEFSIPSFSESSRFLLRYDAEPLHSIVIADAQRGLVREYDAIIQVENTLVILECKVIDSIAGISRKKRDKSQSQYQRKMRRNQRKINRLAHRYDSIQQLLRDLSGVQNIAHIYLIPQDTYLAARSKHGLLHVVENQFGAYFLPFVANFSDFRRRANYIRGKGKLVRKFRHTKAKYPHLFE